MPEPGLYLVNAAGEAIPMAVDPDEDLRDPEMFSEVIDQHNAKGLVAKEHGKAMACMFSYLMANDYIKTGEEDLSIEDLAPVMGEDAAAYAVEYENELLDALEHFEKMTTTPIDAMSVDTTTADAHDNGGDES